MVYYCYTNITLDIVLVTFMYLNDLFLAKEQSHKGHPDWPLHPVLKVSTLVSDDLLWDEEPRGRSIQRGWAKIWKNMGKQSGTI